MATKQPATPVRDQLDLRQQLKRALIEAATVKLWRGALIAVLIGAAVLALPYAPWFPDHAHADGFAARFCTEFGIGIIVAALTGVSIRFLALRSYDDFESEMNKWVKENLTARLTTVHDDLAEGLQGIDQDIRQQTNELIETTESLNVMYSSGISRLYASRSDARDDILRDLQDPEISHIQIIGISLNDFIQVANSPLREVWNLIEDYVLDPVKPGQRTLRIEVLIADPYSYGARLRSFGEVRGRSTLANRLENDVHLTSTQLNALQNHAERLPEPRKVSFAFGFYDVAPILFLMRTDKVSYIQPYYFWAAHDAVNATMPLMRCSDTTHAHLHRGMDEHFSLLWQKASIPASERIVGRRVGIDMGLSQCGAINVFHDPSLARERIAHLLEHTHERLYIEGITLHSFFDDSPNATPNLYAAMAQLIDRGTADINILLLDPTCEQAYYRSYREWLLANPGQLLTFSDYKAKQYHEESRLWRDSYATLDQIRIIKATSDKLHVYYYQSAPSCFVFLTDNSALVEQYHYGKRSASADRATAGSAALPAVNPTLGKEMPLVEYTRTSSELFGTDRRTKPFELLELHCQFVLQNCVRPVLL